MSKKDDEVEYWLDIAQYDLDTAKAMITTKRWLYVGFMCHQVTEKGLKACYWFLQKKAPDYTHNLAFLAEKAGIYNSLSVAQKDLLDELEPLNVEARYPIEKEDVLKRLNEQKCQNLVRQTEEFFLWIKQRLLK